MKKMFVDKLRAAVQSITDCTAPTLQINDVQAECAGLCSPYHSHKEVQYSYYLPLPADTLLAMNDKYAMVIGYVGDDEMDMMPDPTPEGSFYLREWQEMDVPTSFVAPVLELARDVLGRAPHMSSLACVALALRHLDGYYNERPVFRSTISLEDPPAYRQGRLELYKMPVEYANLAGTPYERGSLFNHRWKDWEHDGGEVFGISNDRHVYWSSPACLVTVIESPLVIEAEDHEDLVIDLKREDRGEQYIATHPWPDDGGMVD